MCNGRVHIRSPNSSIMKCNIWCHCADNILTVEWSERRTDTQGIFFFSGSSKVRKETRRFSWERVTEKRQVERRRHSKKEEPMMLLIHWDCHAPWAAWGSGVKEGFHLFYLFCLLFLGYTEHVPFFPFPCFSEAKILIAPDRNLPEWNAFLQ